MAFQNAVDICNTALLIVGAEEITSFDDETREAKVCNQMYETILDATLQKFPWRFSLTTVQLAQLTNPPEAADEFGFDNAYQLPSDSLRVIRTDTATDDYLIFGNILLSNELEVRVEYQFSVSEDQFPAYFRRALEWEIAAVLAMTLEDQAGKYQLLQNKADRELAIAKNIDSQEQPVADVGENNFLFTFVRT